MIIFCKGMEENQHCTRIERERECFLSYIMDSREHGGVCKYNNDCQFRKKENENLDKINNELIHDMKNINFIKLYELIHENKLNKNELDKIKEFVFFVKLYCGKYS